MYVAYELEQQRTRGDGRAIERQSGASAAMICGRLISSESPRCAVWASTTSVSHMTYIKLSDLPLSVRKEFPPGAQEFYMAVYNRTWEQCSASEDYDPRNTAELARKAALLAVETEYERDEHGRWRKASISKVLDMRKIRPQG